LGLSVVDAAAVCTTPLQHHHHQLHQPSKVLSGNNLLLPKLEHSSALCLVLFLFTRNKKMQMLSLQLLWIELI
jgi:hypothetical protein